MLEVVCAELMKSKGLCRAIQITTHGIMASEHHLSGYFLWLLFWRVSLGLRTGGACEWGVGRWEGRGFSVNTLVYTSHRLKVHLPLVVWHCDFKTNQPGEEERKRNLHRGGKGLKIMVPGVLCQYSLPVNGLVCFQAMPYGSHSGQNLTRWSIAWPARKIYGCLPSGLRSFFSCWSHRAQLRGMTTLTLAVVSDLFDLIN